MPEHVSYDPEREAHAAIRDYLAQPVIQPYGTLDLEQLQRWSAAANHGAGALLYPHERYVYGWLRLETAVTASLQDDDEAAKPILDEAEAIFNELIASQRDDPLLQARALIARAGMIVPAIMIDFDASRDKYQAEASFAQAASILLNAYGKSHDRQLLHQLHVLSYILMLNAAGNDSEGPPYFALPVSPRLETDRQYGQDVHLLTLAEELSDTTYRFHGVRVSTDESIKFEYNNVILLPPRLLGNTAFKHGQGQGVLELLQRIAEISVRWRNIGLPPQAHKQRQQLEGQLQPHIGRINSFVLENLGLQSRPVPPGFTLRTLEVQEQTDPEAIATWYQAMLQEARAWYDQLPPFYLFNTDTDQQSLQDSIAAYELAATQGPLTEADHERLGWLYAELGSLSGKSADWQHALEEFGTRLGEAPTDEQRPEWVRNMLGAISVRLWQGLRAPVETPDDPDLLEQREQAIKRYRHELTALFDELGRLFSRLGEKGIRRLDSQLLRTTQQIAVCLGINGYDSEYHDYLAAPAWPRMSHNVADRLGAHVVIIALSGDRRRYPNIEGRIRVEPSSAIGDLAAREQGIVVVAPRHSLPPSIEISDAADLLMQRHNGEELDARATAVLRAIDDLGEELLAHALDYGQL